MTLKICVGDFVFCYGEGLVIFPVESISDESFSAYLGPSVFGDGTGGNENISSLTLVCDSVWAKDFLEFCERPTGTIVSQQETQLKKRIGETTLPSWVVTGVRQWAYENGHSFGQGEVDDLTREWMNRFEDLQRDSER